MDAKARVCTKCVLNSTFPGISFNDMGVCSVCHAYEKKHADAETPKVGLAEMRKTLDRICADAKRKKRQFDVLVPLSGGKDSMYVLYRTVKELGLKPLAFTMDNGYLTQYARDNIDRACKILGVEHIYYCMDPRLMRDLFRLFMEKTGYFCSACMRAIGMATERVAEMYDIPLVFGGTASKVELPCAPEMFQSGKPTFVKNVLKGEVLEPRARHLLYAGSLKRQIGYHMFWWGAQKRLRTYAWVNLPDYLEWNYDTMFGTIRDELGWQSPTGKNEEHIDCAIHKASAYIHNRRWKGSEVRRLNLAGLIHAGQMTREEALKKLDTEPDATFTDADLKPFLDDIGMTRADYDRYLDMGPRYLQYRPRQGTLRKVLSTSKRTVFQTLGVRRG